MTAPPAFAVVRTEEGMADELAALQAACFPTLAPAERIGAEKRKTLGWTLFLIGVLSTIPLALQVFGKRS